MIISISVNYAPVKDSWITARGAESIRSWAIDETSTHLKVVRRNGRTRVFELKPVEFQEGFFFAVGLLPIGAHNLLVTHEQGAFLVDDKGIVKRSMSLSQKGITHTSLSCDYESPGNGTLDLDPIKPIAFNRETIICRDWHDNSHLTLIDKRLKWRGSYSFLNEHVISVSPDASSGWTVSVQRGNRVSHVYIQNNGTLRKSFYSSYRKTLDD